MQKHETISSAKYHHIIPNKIRSYTKAVAKKRSRRGGRIAEFLLTLQKKNELEKEEAARSRKVSGKKSLVKKASSKSSSSEEDNVSISSRDRLNVELDRWICLDQNWRQKVAEVLRCINRGIDMPRSISRYLFEKNCKRKIYETVYEVPNSDIIMYLPLPYLSGGTERRNRQMSFPVDFSSYNIE